MFTIIQRCAQEGILMHVRMCSDQKAVLPSVLFQTISRICSLTTHKIRAKMYETLLMILLLILYF